MLRQIHLKSWELHISFNLNQIFPKSACFLSVW